MWVYFSSSSEDILILLYTLSENFCSQAGLYWSHIYIHTHIPAGFQLVLAMQEAIL